MKCVIIASPGFLRDQFLDFLLNYADKEGLKNIIAQKSKFLLVHSSNGFKHAIKEILSDPAVSSKLSDTKVYFNVNNFFIRILKKNGF